MPIETRTVPATLPVAVIGVFLAAVILAAIILAVIILTGAQRPAPYFAETAQKHPAVVQNRRELTVTDISAALNRAGFSEIVRIRKRGPNYTAEVVLVASGSGPLRHALLVLNGKTAEIIGMRLLTTSLASDAMARTER